tara:strand:+ start:877 stop:1497 length:621 start_codon:yes stop_codon:yes gene_type:complete
MTTAKYCLEIKTSQIVKEAIINKAHQDGKIVVEKFSENESRVIKCGESKAYRTGVDIEISSGRDSGLDMFTESDEAIPPGKTLLVNLGVKCKMIDTTKGGASVGYYMYPRSSIYKTPLRLANSVGIIDKDYRGDLKVPLHNNPDISEYLVDLSNGIDVIEKYTYYIKSGTRLLQVCAPDLSPFSIKFVDELDTTERAEGGFGSTGV